jgi:hypothetical protein
MFTPKGYTTIPAIQNYLLIEITQCFQPQVEEWIAQMESYIETYTGRVFITPEEETEKVFDGNGKKEMKIDEFVSIKSIKINEEEVDEFYTYPNNVTPKDTIVLKENVFTKDYQNVVVEAKWGYSEEVPQDLAFATTVLVAGIINHSLSHEGEVQSFSMGRYSVAYKDQKGWNDYKDAMAILDNYKRYTF